MCIRDRFVTVVIELRARFDEASNIKWANKLIEEGIRVIPGCLLYTSDAADERSSVDLGGRRIIKKKKSRMTGLVQDALGKQPNTKTHT